MRYLVTLAAVVGLLAQSGCPGVGKCKSGTLYVSATFPGPTSTDLSVEVVVDGGTDITKVLPNTAGQTGGSVEIDFQSGYPKGKSVTIVVTGTVNGNPSTLVGSIMLGDDCTALTLAVGDPPDLAGVGGDMANLLNCSAGTHGCGAECVNDTSTDSCGPTSCKPCASPMHGIATCDSAVCGVKCEPGYNACNGDCKSQDDPTSCGPSCAVCALPPNSMSATCDGGRCGFVCKPGYHACGDTCADNTSLSSCGSVSCTPCDAPMGGIATCDGVKCGTQCNDPNFPQLCNGICLAAATPCTGTCAAMSHACSGMCPANTSLNNCGTMCAAAPCPTDPNGTTTCDGTACGLTCDAGFHLCVVNGAQVCISNRSSKSCGATTAACGNICTTVTANAISTCMPDSSGGFACALGCAAGYHPCVDGSSQPICPANTDAKYGCGASSCTACTLPANATGSSCAGGQCAFACKPGFHQCGNTCGDNANVNSCGTNCGPCTTTGLPANSSPDCQLAGAAYVCTFKCDPGYVNCGGVCIRTDDPAHGCGTCGAACNTPSGANATCIGSGICDYACPGATKCKGGCFDSTQTASCGPSCQTCTAPSGGTVSCNGTNCVPACPSGQSICPTTNTCITTGSPCAGTCGSGTHLCGGVCVSDSSTSQCGTGCADCTTANSTVACQGGACTVTACASGYHQCNGAGACHVDNDTANCGTGCAACSTTVGNATAICSGGSCTFQCNSGTYCAAAGACITGCCNASDCPLATNATATCNVASNVGTCNYACVAPWVNCSGSSIASAGCTSTLGTDAHCGSCSNVCTSLQTCNGTTCIYDCLSNCDCGCTTTHTCKACPCFVAGTAVSMADGTTKPIEAVVVGDSVLAYDEASGTVQTGTVSTIFVHPETHDFISLQGGRIITTPEHPFFVAGQWVLAGKLRVGDTLTVLGGAGALTPLRLDSVSRYSGSETTYNLNVDTYHTYFVDGIVVHNKIPR